ncbi:hypothetical protein [Spongiactinospora gelatinilytica]|uniref:hypothetical protein n=1 Tax=Spongiactinospora gelatinilytica TaxID=2666298 RepID=UPI0013149B8D|nr:hypothetical protein [Spongiactinospora gelatinilytica]
MPRDPHPGPGCPCRACGARTDRLARDAKAARRAGCLTTLAVLPMALIRRATR